MISFVGAGPGDPELITIAGAKRLAEADIVIWAESLIPRTLLNHCSDTVTTISSASMTLEDVTDLYIKNHEANIVRLHSGDPSIYGALQEQIDFCIDFGLNYEVIPGVTSLSATAACLGRELTIPRVSQSVIITRLSGKTSDSMPSREKLESFARIGGTIAVFLSASYPSEMQESLLCSGSAFTASTPVVIATRATWPDQNFIHTDIGNLASTLKDSGFKRTVLVVVGDALSGKAARSHLYRPDFAHKFRKRSLVGTTVGRQTKAKPNKL